jgi:hypothetical protein
MPDLRFIPAALLLSFLAAPLLAGEKITLSNGEVVILSDDGTWNYEKRPVQRYRVIKTGQRDNSRSHDCNYPTGGHFNGYNLWINPADWRRSGTPELQSPIRPID